MIKQMIVTTVSGLFFLVLWGCTATYTGDRSRVKPAEGQQGSEQQESTPMTPQTVNFGKAAYYSGSARGKLTASGETYDPARLTAAHVSLPFGSICRVTNMSNGKTVEVRVNDRFSGSGGRIILLSYEAANRLNAIQAGIIEVKVEVLKRPGY